MAKTRYNRKHKKNMRKKSRKMRKRQRKYKKRGGGVNGPLAAAPFLPPNGPVNVPIPGITNKQVQQYYYVHNGRVVPNPESTNKALVMKRGGRKSRRKHKKRKSKKPSRKSHKKTHKKRRRRRNKRRKHKGGNLSKIIEAIPGGTDVRDVYYNTTSKLGSLYSQYNGYGPTDAPPTRSYLPKFRNVNVDGHAVPLSQYVGDGSNQVAKPKFSANYN